ncbi:LIPA.2 family protein [Megaselia abdita]
MDLVVWLVILGIANSATALFKLSTPEIIKQDGYPVETHEIITSDGYEITFFRIPTSPKFEVDNKTKPVVLAVHGFISSSDVWILSGPDNSLAYNLADAGFDVWLSNARGNSYGLKNNKILFGRLSPRFWDFSWNEIANIDLPAQIDYILEKTGQPALHYIGHSQGTTSYCALLSDQPEYNEKILTGSLLSPVVFMDNMDSPFAPLLPLIGNAPAISALIGNFEFLPQTNFLALFGSVACREKSITNAICSNVIFLAAGFDPGNLNYTLVPKITATHPAGSSTGQFLHYIQNYISGGFNHYDYGFIKNRLKYGSKDPPAYNLSNIKVPTSLYYGNNDYLSSQIDVQRLASELSNVREVHEIDVPTWNHFDFVWAINVKEKVNIPVLNSLASFIDQQNN